MKKTVLMALLLTGCANMEPGTKKAVIIAGGIVAAALIVSSNDDDQASPAAIKCGYVVGPNGSTQVCR